MAHFAKIENDTVVNVIVAEQQYIDQIDGEWIQTSYNTRAGVHYGQDGNPDGVEALRKNYASIGFTYDRVRDAFIAPKPSNLYVLNENQCVWYIEYQPFLFVLKCLSSIDLPVGNPGENLVIDTLSISDKKKVLFYGLTADPGIYEYNIQAGTFLRIQNDISYTVAEKDDQTFIYRYIDNNWTRINI